LINLTVRAGPIYSYIVILTVRAGTIFSYIFYIVIIIVSLGFAVANCVGDEKRSKFHPGVTNNEYIPYWTRNASAPSSKVKFSMRFSLKHF
jgi:hypothetical protein